MFVFWGGLQKPFISGLTFFLYGLAGLRPAPAAAHVVLQRLKCKELDWKL